MKQVANLSPSTKSDTSLGFSRYIWLDTKIVLKKIYNIKIFINQETHYLE